MHVYVFTHLRLLQPEESLSDDFLFPMSSLRLSYASSPESDLEHSPGPPASSAGSGPGPTPGRLTKASSDPSVVMPMESGNGDTLPPYQVRKMLIHVEICFIFFGVLIFLSSKIISYLVYYIRVQRVENYLII